MPSSPGLWKAALLSTALACAAGGPVLAAPVHLSDYLGVPTGSFTTASNLPYTTVVSQAYGFGADSPGNFASNPIEFSDAGPFAKAIGATPPENGETRIDFNLDALRADGLVFDTFFARVGIDVPSGGNEGAQFSVFLDGLLVDRAVVQHVGEPSIDVEVALGTASVLGLSTSRVGQNHGNHAAWADARLELVQPVPLPAAVWLLGSTALGLGTIRRHKT